MRIERGLLALASLLSLAGCPGTLEDKERFLAAANAGAAGKSGSAGSTGVAGSTPAEAGRDAGTGPCADAFERIIVPSCGDSGCHGTIATQQDLDLVSPGVAARVVGVPGTACPVTLADPQNPEASLIYQKLIAPPPCGAQMPLARPALSSDDVACVRAWIAGLQ